MSIYTLSDLRSAAKAAGVSGSDEFLVQDYARRANMDPTEVANKLGYDGGTGSMSGERFSASADSYQSNLYGLGGAAARAMGADRAGAWMDRGRDDNKFQADVASQRARSLGAVDDWRDITGPGSALNYAGGLAIQSAPYLAESLVGGVVGRGLATGAKVALRGAGTAEAASAARSTLNRAGMAGATVASYPSAVGDILSNQREENGGENLSMAALGGVPYAALNGALGADALLARGFHTTDLLTGGLAKRMGKAAGRTALEEGISETGQEMVNQGFGRMAVNPDQTLFNPDANKRYVDSFVGGATLGGLLGSAGGLRRGAPPVQDNTTTDLLNAPTLGLQWNGETQSAQGQTPFTVFPDGSTATSQDQELQRRYGISPDQMAATRMADETNPRVDPRMASGDLSPYLPGTMVADQGGQVALDAPGADALYGRENGDLGTAIARENWLKQKAEREAAQQAREESQARVIEKTKAIQAVDQLAATYGVKGTAALKVFHDLKAMQDSGQITQGQLEENAALLAASHMGSVKSWMKAIGPTTEAGRAPLNQTPINTPAPAAKPKKEANVAQAPQAVEAKPQEAPAATVAPVAPEPVTPLAPLPHAEHDGVYLHKLGVQDAGQALREHDETMNIMEELVNCLKKKR